MRKIDKFEDRNKGKEDFFIVTYQESGDDIHFVLLSMDHYKHVIDSVPNLYNGIDVEDTLDYIMDNSIDHKYVQTYTDNDFFGKFDIKRAVYVPELGM